MSSLLGSLTDATAARRRLTWSSTSRSTSPRTQRPTSPARSAIKGSPASPASSLTSCYTRRRRSVADGPDVKRRRRSLRRRNLPGLSSRLQNLICPECGDEFVLQSQLSLHLEEHRKELSGVRVYTCKTCEKEFKTAAHLKEHMKSHAKMRSAGFAVFGWVGIVLDFPD